MFIYVLVLAIYAYYLLDTVPAIILCDLTVKRLTLDLCALNTLCLSFNV